MVRRQRAPTVKIDTTLSGTVNDSTTTWTVASAANMPSEGDFFLACETEVVLVTGRSGTTLTVERGAAGSTADAHTSGAAVESIIVAEEFTNRLRDYGQIKAIEYGRLVDINGDPLSAADFSLINTSTGSAVNDGPDGTIEFSLRTHTGNDLSGCVRQISSADGDRRYTAHLCGITPNPDAAGAGDHFGFQVQQPVGGQMHGLEFYPGEKIQYEERATYLADPATSTPVHGAPHRRDVWFQLEFKWDYNFANEGLWWRYSYDGVHWFEMNVEDHASSAINVGLWASVRSGVVNQKFNILSWVEEAI